MQINLKEVRRNLKSLNTNIEKDLGWFYNFAHEDKQYRYDIYFLIISLNIFLLSFNIIS